jgi:hypothetical protein
MDVEAAVRTDMSGRLCFDTAVNTVHLRDVLSIVVELPCAPLVERLGGATLVGAVAENLVTRRGKPMLLTLTVNGGRGRRLGDGVDAPSKPASLAFPHVREPHRRTDLPLPAFSRS